MPPRDTSAQPALITEDTPTISIEPVVITPGGRTMERSQYIKEAEEERADHPWVKREP